MFFDNVLYCVFMKYMFMKCANIYTTYIFIIVMYKIKKKKKKNY
jgi:hypothetical protein